MVKMVGTARIKLVTMLLYLVGEVLSACTIAVVGSSVYGRPILWKNRDVHGIHQEVRYFHGAVFDFITNVYRGETNRAWAGINSAGFGIINTDNYNQMPPGSSGPGDGEVMFYALGHFSNIEEFQNYLDNTNITGRRSAHCYGVFDSYGGAAIFEADRFSYVRFDADDAPNGVLVRANYADSGLPEPRTGAERRARAEQIIDLSSWLDPDLFIFTIARDLATAELDPYPLPFAGSFGSLPYGVISTHHTINRYYTSSSSVLVGRDKGGTPAIMWEYLGQPIVSIPIPLWVEAGSVPTAMASPSGSILCDLSNRLKSIVYTGTSTIDTYILDNILDLFLPAEQEISLAVASLYRRRPSSFDSPEELLAIENYAVALALDKYSEIISLYIKENIHALPEKTTMSIFPNPFNGTGTIDVYYPSSGVCDLVIFDISGREIARPATNHNLRKGHNRIPITLDKQPSGVYATALVIDGEVVSTAKFVFAK